MGGTAVPRASSSMNSVPRQAYWPDRHRAQRHAQRSKENPYVIPENTGPAAVIVLAAGAGTRMKSRTPKILHEIGGRSMVGHALLAARSINPGRLALVVRHERDLVAGHLNGAGP